MSALSAEERQIIASVGGVSISTDDLISERGFAEGSLLDAHLEAWAAASGVSEDALWAVSSQALVDLVVTKLLPRLALEGVMVEVRAEHYNPARAYLIDGLTKNEAALCYVEVQLDGDEIATAVARVVDGKSTEGPESAREDVMEDGLRAFEGRSVVVAVGGGDDISGTLVRAREDGLVLLSADQWNGDVLSFVPLLSVRGVSSYQMTASESSLVEQEREKKRG